MKRVLAVAAVFVTVVLLAFCVTKVIGRPMLPDPEDESGQVMSVAAVYSCTIRLDGLEKSSQSGITSRYVITNLASVRGTTAHEFYNELDQPLGQIVASLGANEAASSQLADVGMLPDGYRGYAIVMADQPITGTVLPSPTVFHTYIPLVVKQPPQAPLLAGEIVRFRGAWEDVPLAGKVVFSEYRNVLVDDYSGPVYPGGVFVVVIMDVESHGLTSDEVGRYGSFKAKDSVGRQFDIAELEVLWAAEDEYGYDSVYEAIQPGFTKRLIFVFDVLPASEDLHLVSLSPW